MKSIILTIIPFLAVSALANGADTPKPQPFQGEDFSLRMESAVNAIGNAAVAPAPAGTAPASAAAPAPAPASAEPASDFTIGQLDCETLPDGTRVFSRLLTGRYGTTRQIVRVIVPRGIKI